MIDRVDAHRVDRLRMSAAGEGAATSVRGLERQLELAGSPPGLLLDLTYADTKRWPAPEWTLDRFGHAVRYGESYTPYRGDLGVRGTVAGAVGRFLGVPVDPERNLILTPGTQAALFGAVAALVSPGDGVVLLDPEYLASERLLLYHGARVARVPIHWRGGGSPVPALDLLEERLGERPRLVVLSHPNNPTGAVYSGDLIRQLAELFVRHDTLVLLDGLYSRLVYDDDSYSHLAAEPGMAERTITLLGPSKTESMSGFRVGVAVAPAWIVDAMEDVLSISALRAPAYAQHLLTRWIVDDEEYVKQRVTDYQDLRDWTVDRLLDSELFDLRIPMGSAYIYPRPLDVAASEQEVALSLKREAGVVVNPGYQFGSAWPGHFRMCFAQDERTFDAALDRMFETIRHLQRESTGSSVGKEGSP